MDGIRQAESENRREGGAIVKIISLGWGVQSFTLAAMAALGETEPVDAAIHADTAHEASGTYEFARQWAPLATSQPKRAVCRNVARNQPG